MKILGFGCVAAALALLGPACGPAPLDAGDYDRSCKTADECVTVFIGDCSAGGCTCANVAINRGDLARYQHDFSEQHCDGLACPCTPLETSCFAGKCAIGSPH